MSKTLLKIGLVGVGYLGSRHLRHLVELDGVGVAGIWDIDKASLYKVSSEFDVKAASSLKHLLSLSDGLVLATPTSTHFEIGTEVLDHGKPLFVEKPVCATVDEARLLVEQAERKGVPVQVGHIERFNRAFRALEQVDINPRFIEAHRIAPWSPRGIDVAVVHDLMIHDLDLILALAKGEPSHIHANGVGVVTDSVDIATSRIEFSDGLVANVTASRISLKKMRKLRLFGESEYIVLDLDKGKCEYIGVTDRQDQIPPSAQPLGEIMIGTRQRRLHHRFLEVPYGDSLRLELESFRDAVLNGTPPLVSGGDGLKALELAERIVHAIREN